MTTNGQTRVSEVHKDFPKNWGRWGDADEIGALNYLDAAQAVRAAQSVRSGRRFALSLEILRPGGDPAIAIRGQVKKFMTADKGFFATGQLSPMGGGIEYCDDLVIMYLQASTQIDALGHVWYDDQLWNGYSADVTIGTLRKCSVKPMADHGIVGRGVLLDIPRYKAVQRLGANQQVTLADLLGCAESQGVALEKRDILLIRTGWLPIFYEQGMDALMGAGEPGITDEPALVHWFQEMEIPTFGSDTIGGEQSFSSVSGIVLPLHGALMRNLGIPFQEMLWLEDLAADCAADRQYDFMYVVSPLKIHGGTGSPINPLAIK